MYHCLAYLETENEVLVTYFIEVELSLYAYFIELLAALKNKGFWLRKMMTHKSSLLAVFIFSHEDKSLQ